MKEKKQKMTSAQKSELNWKIAEIIWYSIGGIILLAGVVFSVLGLLIINMEGNFTHHPFYPLYKAQGEFFGWLGFGSTFSNAGLMLILFAVVYFCIVFYIFAKRQDIKDKKKKIKNNREKSLKLIIEEEQN